MMVCDLSLFRSFAKPPQQVQTVCECIVILRGYKEVNWKTAKGMMAETNFLNSLQHMDVDGISQGQVTVLCKDKVTSYLRSQAFATGSSHEIHALEHKKELFWIDPPGRLPCS